MSSPTFITRMPDRLQTHPITGETLLTPGELVETPVHPFLLVEPPPEPDLNVAGLVCPICRATSKGDTAIWHQGPDGYYCEPCAQAAVEATNLGGRWSGLILRVSDVLGMDVGPRHLANYDIEAPQGFSSEAPLGWLDLHKLAHELQQDAAREAGKSLRPSVRAS